MIKILLINFLKTTKSFVVRELALLLYKLAQCDNSRIGLLSARQFEVETMS